MNKKIITGYICAIFVVLLMTSSVTAINLTQPQNVLENEDDKKDTIVSEEIEKDNNLEEEKPAGLFSGAIIVQTYIIVQGRFLLARGAKVYCKEKGTTTSKASTSFGFLSLAYFFGLKVGTTYVIYSKYSESTKEEVKVSLFPKIVRIRVG